MRRIGFAWWRVEMAVVLLPPGALSIGHVLQAGRRWRVAVFAHAGRRITRPYVDVGRA